MILSLCPDILRDALYLHDYNILKTAKYLKIPRNKVCKLMAEWGIENIKFSLVHNFFMLNGEGVLILLNSENWASLDLGHYKLAEDAAMVWNEWATLNVNLTIKMNVHQLNYGGLL